MMPLLLTPEPTRYTLPPLGVVMLPRLSTEPASALGWKLSRPARKSWLLRLSVEATSPATSILAPSPTRIPEGLIRNTRPLEVSVPSSTEGSCPTTRLSTLEAALCWMKRVVSPGAIEKPCQLMIAPGVLVTFSVEPRCAIDACPLTTCGPTGLPRAPGTDSEDKTRAASSFRSNERPACGARNTLLGPSRRKASLAAG